jgi:hypothetical protein
MRGAVSMSSKALALSVRVAAAAIVLCLLALLAATFPSVGADFIFGYAISESWRTPWLVFVWAASMPLFAIMSYVWKVSGAIGREEVFTRQVARWIKTSSILLFSDVAFFFCGNLALLIAGKSYAIILAGTLLLDVLGIFLALAAAVLSRYIVKAAALQEESDATI